MSRADTTHAADSHDLIRVTGARENNLKDVDLELPKRRLTVFTGVSGSGKSSLVFDTIAAESQRLINETYSAFVQGFMPSWRAQKSTSSKDSPPRSSSTSNAWVPIPAPPSAPPPTPGDVANPVQPVGRAAHRLPAGVLVQRRLDQRGRRGDVRRAARPSRSAATSTSSAACARAARAAARSTTST